jgi:hypothetical protein
MTDNIELHITDGDTVEINFPTYLSNNTVKPLTCDNAIKTCDNDLITCDYIAYIN